MRARPTSSYFRWSLLGLCTPLLLACASASKTAPPAEAALQVPAGWQAPLPHGGEVQSLRDWWSSLGDPVLVQLQDAAQAVSPSLASASARLALSRAALGSAQAANLPTLDASLSAQRGVNASSPTVGTGLQSNLGASWEIDIFGANRKTALAASARLQGAQAQWHEARVAVAADLAARYWGWRNCMQVLELVRADAASRQTSADLTALNARAGFASPAAAGLARASAAEGNARAQQQKAACDSSIKALVALTAMDEPALLRLLQAPASLPTPPAQRVVQLPAQVLSQRPDLYAAEREVAAASADLGAAQAQRYPRLALAGSVGTLNYTNSAGSTDLSTWSIGPVSLSLPLLDGGRRSANIEAAQARYQEAAALYQARARQAVREVEESLLALASTEDRQREVDSASVGYRQFFETTQARYQAGMASLPELEDARRTALAAQMAVAQLALERTQAWVGLYRALGGGWRQESPEAAPSPNRP